MTKDQLYEMKLQVMGMAVGIVNMYHSTKPAENVSVVISAYAELWKALKIEERGM